MDKLSKDFSLREFELSSYATQRGYVNKLPKKYYKNVVKLVTTVLQPLRDTIGIPVIISSGYRSYKVNAGIGGVENSRHIKALAADIYTLEHTPIELTQIIIDEDLPFDTVIHEFGRWTHVDVTERTKKARKRVMTAHKIGSNKTRYAAGNLPVDENRRLA